MCGLKSVVFSRQQFKLGHQIPSWIPSACLRYDAAKAPPSLLKCHAAQLARTKVLRSCFIRGKTAAGVIKSASQHRTRRKKLGILRDFEV